MRIPSHLLNQCFAEGAARYPEEACGLLSGPTSEPEALSEFHPIANQLNRMHELDPVRYSRTARDGYYLDPMTLLKTERSLKEQGREVRVIFHSHPDVGAYFSEEDVQRALWDGRPVYPGVIYLVCGIKQGQPDGAILAVYNEQTQGFDVRDVAEPGTDGPGAPAG
jgi:proteasome lid subunit RPN8/RPN11